MLNNISTINIHIILFFCFFCQPIMADPDCGRPKDNDACLQQSPHWGNSYTCSTSTGYCTSWEKDMKRCCPISCGSEDFTEEDCNISDRQGKCTYPNDAQCPEKEYIVDCQWSEWQTVLYTNHNGTTCGQLNCTRNGMSPQVSNGLKNRTRIIPASLHGRDCEGGETEQCTANCPEHCQLTAWSAWSWWNEIQNCGWGVQNRTSKKMGNYGGISCEELTKTEPMTNETYKNCPGIFQFQKSSYRFTEKQGSAVITIVRESGNSSSVIVNLRWPDKSTSDTIRYDNATSSSMSSVTFENKQEQLDIPLSILDSYGVGENKTFRVELLSVIPVNHCKNIIPIIGPRNVTIITITDDDGRTRPDLTAILVTSFVLLALIIISFLVIKKYYQKHAQPKDATCYTVKLQSFTKDSESLRTGNSPKPRPMKTPQVIMPLTIKNILRNDVKPRLSEYNELKDLDCRLHCLKFSTNIARKFNGYKQGDSKPVTFNRFNTILPYDHTLIKLNEPIEECNYINASWMTTASHSPFNKNKNISQPSPTKISFIASQGPLLHTIPQHLQMIHEQRPCAIVMLTELEEGPKDEYYVSSKDSTKMKSKCAQYWPCKKGDINAHAHMHVKLLKESLMFDSENELVDDILERDLEICNQNAEYQYDHRIKHLQYVGWPDHGAPKTTRSIIALAKLIRKIVASETCSVKILVHCSAGVGRTGTFIALYQLMEMLDEKVAKYKLGSLIASDNSNNLEDLTIDIFNTVFNLRKKRCEMVQSFVQYEFLHQCVVEYAKEVEQKLENDATDVCP